MDLLFCSKHITESHTYGDVIKRGKVASHKNGYRRVTSGQNSDGEHGKN